MLLWANPLFANFFSTTEQRMKDPESSLSPPPLLVSPLFEECISRPLEGAWLRNTTNVKSVVEEKHPALKRTRPTWAGRVASRLGQAASASLTSSAERPQHQDHDRVRRERNWPGRLHNERDPRGGQGRVERRQSGTVRRVVSTSRYPRLRRHIWRYRAEAANFYNCSGPWVGHGSSEQP